MMSELEVLYNEDQDDRANGVWEEGPERDHQRLVRVLDLLQAGHIQDPADCLHAAMILQHGSNTEHFKAAQQLARRSVDAGYVPKEGEPDPLWLIAVAEDRALVSQGLPQKYGTQYTRFEDGTWSFSTNIDPIVTDEERARMHVPTLDEARKKLRAFQDGEGRESPP
jgi:hypothetical protein